MAEIFDGWDVGAENDIFDAYDREQEKTEGSDKDPKSTDPDLEDKEKNSGSTEKEPEKEKDPFEEVDKEEKELGSPEKEDEEPGEEKTPNILQILGEKGFIEIGEDEEIDEAKMDDILEDKMEEAFDKKFGEMYKDFPPEVRALNEYVYKGGDPAEFFKSMANTSGSIGSLDMTSEDNQIKVAEMALAEEGHDEEFIKAQIDFLKDSKKLEAYASTKQKAYKKKEDKNKEDLVSQQRERVEKEKESLRKMKQSIIDEVSKGEFENITISDKEAKTLPTYIVDRNIKTDNGGSISEFQKDLLETLNDPKKITVLAKLIKNGFDFSDIKGKAVTDQTKKIKKDLQRAKDSQKMGGDASSSKRSLADFF